MTATVDALIVGGGPAGLAAAIVLGQAGLSVLLCERRQFPIDKVCGEGLMPTGVAHLQQLGVCDVDHFPFAGVRYLIPGGPCAQAPFREGPGWGIRRTALSAALHARVQRLQTVCILPGTSAAPQDRDEKGVRVRVGEQNVCARLLVCADGLHSPLRRWAGLQAHANGSLRRHWRWGARRHFALAPWSDCVEVYWSGRGVEAYVTPVGPCQVGVAFLWHRDRYKALRGGAALIPSLLAAFPALQERLQGATPLSDGRAVGPLQQRVRAASAPGLLLIGDAAGYLDAITGEGLSLAFAQAHALKDTVIPDLQSATGIVPRQALAAYDSACRRLNRSGLQLTELALLLSRYPALCRHAIRALQHDPTLFQHLLSANMGLQSPFRPSTFLRLTRALLPFQR